MAVATPSIEKYLLHHRRSEAHSAVCGRRHGRIPALVCDDPVEAPVGVDVHRCHRRDWDGSSASVRHVDALAIPILEKRKWLEWGRGFVPELRRKEALVVPHVSAVELDLMSADAGADTVGRSSRRRGADDVGETVAVHVHQKGGEVAVRWIFARRTGALARLAAIENAPERLSEASHATAGLGLVKEATLRRFLGEVDPWNILDHFLWDGPRVLRPRKDAAIGVEALGELLVEIRLQGLWPPHRAAPIARIFPKSVRRPGIDRIPRDWASAAQGAHRASWCPLAAGHERARRVPNRHMLCRWILGGALLAGRSIDVHEVLRGYDIVIVRKRRHLGVKRLEDVLVHDGRPEGVHLLERDVQAVA